MSLSSALNIINSAFVANAGQSAVISSNISNASTTSYAREIANLITTSGGGVEVASVDARGQRRAARPGQYVDVAGRLPAGVVGRPDDAGADGERQLLGDLVVRRRRERQFAVGDARQPAERARNLRRLAEPARRRRRRVVTAASDLTAVAQHRRRGGAERARAGRFRHGLVGHHHQFAAQPVHLGQRDDRLGHGDAAPTSRSAEDTRDSILTQLVAANRHLDRRQSRRLDVDLHRQRRDAVPGERARTVSFTPTATLTDGASGNAVTVDGVPITGVVVADGDPVRRARGLRQPARRRRAAIRRAARPDRRRPHQRLRRERSDRRNRADAARPVHLFRRDRRALDFGDDRPRVRDRGQRQRRSVAGRQRQSLARRRHRRSDQFRLHLQHDRRGELHRPHRAVDQRHDVDPDRSTGRPGSERRRQPQRLRQRLGELAAGPEPAGEQSARLSEFAGQPGDDGAVERDWRQSRHRNDQHAEHRELVHDDRQAADDRQCDVHRRCSTLCEANGYLDRSPPSPSARRCSPA